jgi:hypothetical protein
MTLDTQRDTRINLTFAVAILADLLHPLHHVRADLTCDDLNAVTTTRRALLLRTFASADTEQISVDANNDSYETATHP